MIVFTAAENDTFKRANLMAVLDRLLFVPGFIGPSVVLNAYNVYLFDHSDGVWLTFLSPVSHSSYWRHGI